MAGECPHQSQLTFGRCSKQLTNIPLASGKAQENEASLPVGV